VCVCVCVCACVCVRVCVCVCVCVCVLHLVLHLLHLSPGIISSSIFSRLRDALKIYAVLRVDHAWPPVTHDVSMGLNFLICFSIALDRTSCYFSLFFGSRQFQAVLKSNETHGNNRDN